MRSRMGQRRSRAGHHDERDREDEQAGCTGEPRRIRGLPAYDGSHMASPVTDVTSCAQHAWPRGGCQSPDRHRCCQLSDTATVGTGNRRAASGRGRYLVPSATCAEPVSRLARRSRVLVSLTGTLTPESLLGAVISAIRRGQQLLRVVIGHLG